MHLAYWGYRGADLAARTLPSSALPALERGLGHIGRRVLADRAAQVDRNIRRVYGDQLSAGARREMAAETFASYIHYWTESFRLPGTSADDLDRGFRVDGFGHIEEALDAGRGAVVAMPHLGGWEWAAFWLTEVQGMPVSAVVEKVAPPELASWFMDLRRAFGIDVIMLDDRAGHEALKALRSNRILCLLCDRDISGDGVEVNFFGERTTLPAGPATLALRSGAALIPAAVYFDGRDHEAVVKPRMPVEREGRLRDDVQRITQDLAAELESLIRVAPEQWHLMQPNWPSDRL